MQIKSLSSIAPVTKSQFQLLSEIEPINLWCASIQSTQTRRAYRRDARDFMSFLGIICALDLAKVKRAHLLSWRASLQGSGLCASTVCRKLAAVSSMYEFLIDEGQLQINPMVGLKRPRVDSYEGKTPRLSTRQAELLLNAPPTSSVKGLRDRAILSMLLFHGLRRQELCNLRIGDFAQMREGAPHLCIHGKGGKTRYVPLRDHTLEAVLAYLQCTTDAELPQRALFLQLHSGRSASVPKGISADGDDELLTVVEHVYDSTWRPQSHIDEIQRGALEVVEKTKSFETSMIDFTSEPVQLEFQFDRETRPWAALGKSSIQSDDEASELERSIDELDDPTLH